MVTVQTVYDAAIDLMDEQNESNGSTKTVDTREYELRTISILNMGIQALYPYSSNYEREAPGRPCGAVLLAEDRSNPDFTQGIGIDDALCIGLLPYFLASLLRSGEDTEFSMRMMQEYNTALVLLRDKAPAEFEAISTPYGLF